MKKGLFAAVLALAIAAPATVFAEEATSPVAGEGKIVIEERESNAGVKVGDNGAAVNAAWGTKLDAKYVVVFVGEAYVDPEGYEGELTLTVKASDFKGGELFIHHKKDGTNDVDATVTLNSKDLSPVAVVKLLPDGGEDGNAGDGGTANTGDSNKAGLWAGALVISALLAGAAFFMKKRSA